MRIPLPLILISVAIACDSNQGRSREGPPSKLTAAVSPIATVSVIGNDTLSDSLRLYELKPEPDGGSVAFLFADASKGVTRGLAIVQTSGSQHAQLVWPDSVISAWWSGPHQLSFTSGTGRGVRVIIDAHAAQLQSVDPVQAKLQTAEPAREHSFGTNLVPRAQAFIDSIRIQPNGQPQHSSLRYQADSTVISPNDTLAAIHVSAVDPQGGNVNPAWYLIHIPTGQMQAIDSLTGRSLGLAASAGQWGADGSFYYAKERSIWKAQPSVERQD